MSKLFRRIEDIEVWKRGCRFAVEMCKLTGQGAFDKDWALKDQIRRAAISVPANVAEGFERESSKEFQRFLLIAKGSCGELRTHLYIAQALDYLEKTEAQKFINECIELSSMISSLLNHLNKNRHTKVN